MDARLKRMRRFWKKHSKARQREGAKISFLQRRIQRYFSRGNIKSFKYYDFPNAIFGG